MDRVFSILRPRLFVWLFVYFIAAFALMTDSSWMGFLLIFFGYLFYSIYLYPWSLKKEVELELNERRKYTNTNL